MSDIWEMLEQDAPDGCGSVQDLYSWSLNYDASAGPFTLFLDLLGYGMEEYGVRLYDMDKMLLGYVELSKLAAALESYSARPHEVTAYVAALMAAEGEG